MTRNQTKLISAAITLLLSIVMLAGASFAWFTISTAPEITGMQVTLYTDLDLLVSKTGAEGTFTQSVSTDSKREAPVKGDTSIDNLPFYADLRPTSTYDGINWYRATYYDGPTTTELLSGSLRDVSEFDELAEAVHANVLLWDEDENGNYTKTMAETSELYMKRFEESYYIYADVWLKTENEEGVKVTLSVPDIKNGASHDNGLMQQWELQKDGSQFGADHGLKYGSYALARYEKYEGETAAAPIGNNVFTALRVGFLTEDGNFTIWEPNADKRSVATYKPKKGQLNEPGYIVGYELDPDPNTGNYKDNHYIPTYPIIKGENGLPAVADNPPWDSLLIQRACEWGSSITGNYKNPTSADIRHFGEFVTDNSVLKQEGLTNMTALKEDETGLASQNIILTLWPEEPQRVRIFFWLEGQDVDCWNDIASGSFIVNLEFAAQPEKPEPRSTEPAETTEPAVPNT